RTRHHVGTVLKACLQAAVDIGKLLQVNPAATIRKPSAGDSDVGQALEQEKIEALVEGFRGSTLFDFTFLMAFTGMRRGEALALRWSDGGIEVDLSLVRIPDDWPIFPAPDGQLDEPRPASS